MKEKFKRRFHELTETFAALKFENNGISDYVPNGEWRGWATNAQNLILATFGKSAPHYINFIAVYAKGSSSRTDVMSLFSIFKSARDDFEGGYIFDIELQVSGEVFGDFVALARHSLSEGQKDVASVLACAALEDALKRYASASGLTIDGKTMADVVNALKSEGLVAGAQKSLLDAMPRIRNMAMHGEWSKISEPDVASVLGFVEQFLLSKFSNN